MCWDSATIFWPSRSASSIFPMALNFGQQLFANKLHSFYITRNFILGAHLLSMIQVLGPVVCSNKFNNSISWTDRTLTLQFLQMGFLPVKSVGLSSEWVQDQAQYFFCITILIPIVLHIIWCAVLFFVLFLRCHTPFCVVDFNCNSATAADWGTALESHYSSRGRWWQFFDLVLYKQRSHTPLNASKELAQHSFLLQT